MAQRHHVGRVRALGLVLLGGRVAQSDLLLVVEPLLVALPHTGVTDPLHEALLDRRLVGLVGLAVRAADLHVRRVSGDRGVSNLGTPCRMFAPITTAETEMSSGETALRLP